MATRESFAEILRNLCDQLDWELLPSGVNVIHPNGRHQVVSFEIFEFEAQQLVRLVTTIGAAQALRQDHMEQALRANSSLAHGALALEGDDLCMTDTLSLEEAGSEEIESAVAFLAEMADYYEHVLFGTDTHWSLRGVASDGLRDLYRGQRAEGQVMREGNRNWWWKNPSV